MAKTEPIKPSITQGRAACQKLEKAWVALEAAQFELGLLVYDAGNRDLDTFVEAMDKATSGAWALWGGCVPIEAARAKELFRQIKARVKR
jgi:hypothetical protein